MNNEEVNSFTYLAAQVTRDGGETLDTKKGTALAYANIARLKKSAQEASAGIQRYRTLRQWLFQCLFTDAKPG